MAVLTPSTLKAKFETGDQPNGSDFANLIDSFRSKLEMIPAAEVQGLAALITAAVDARTSTDGTTDLSVLAGSDFLQILSSSGTPAFLQAATPDTPGIVTPSLYALFTSGAGVPAPEPEETVNEVVTLTVSGSLSWPAPAIHLLSNFVVTPSSAGELRIGNTPGGDELFSTDAAAGELLIADILRFTTSPADIHFTGEFRVQFLAQNYGAGITDIAVINVDGTERYTSPGAALLQNIVVIPTSSGEFRAGTTAGADDIAVFQAVAGVPQILDVIRFHQLPTDIFFTGTATVRLNIISYA